MVKEALEARNSKKPTAMEANTLGNVHGGVIMKLCDEAGGMAAARHAGRPAVTVAVDSMRFLSPVHVGDLVTIHAQAKAAMRLTICVWRRWPVVATKPRAVRTAIAAQTPALMALAEVISAAYLNCNTYRGRDELTRPNFGQQMRGDTLHATLDHLI